MLRTRLIIFLGDENLKRTKNPHEIRKEKEGIFLIAATTIIVSISLIATFAISM